MNNMKLTEIQEMWKNDCQIDDIELDASSLKVPQLHAKYAELLAINEDHQKLNGELQEKLSKYEDKAAHYRRKAIL